MEIRSDEIVIGKPKIAGSYTKYYTSTQTQKLRKVVNIKEILHEEVAQRNAVH